MTFGEAEAYLLGLEQFGMRFGLERMEALMAALGAPQKRYRSVHVVGTNGKSSTARFVAAILERHSVRTGLYTSPHLVSFRERIEVGESALSEGRFALAVGRAAAAARAVDAGRDADDRVTQFEALTAAALSELGEAGVEVGVIEAGLGGRLDATNVIGSAVTVLTGVSLEHTRWLGSTVTDIAREKVDVLEPGSTLVLGGDLHPDARRVAEAACEQRGARLVVARSDPGEADFQTRNFSLARAAAEAFAATDPSALDSARTETGVPGRLEVVGREPLTVLDGAHNPGGTQALAAALPALVGERRPLVLVLSVLADKDVKGVLEPLRALGAELVFTRCANPRALDPAKLRGDGGGEVVPDPHAALRRAREIAGPGGAVVATGSIYLIADLKRGAGAGRGSTL